MKIDNRTKKELYIPIFGGLGNQMFQLAHALNISKLENYELKLVDYTKSIGSIDRNWNLDCFGFQASKTTSFKKKYLKIKINLSNLLFKLGFRKNLLILNEVYLGKGDKYDIINKRICIGYWQSEKYFSDYKKEINKYFTFKKDLSIPEVLMKNINKNTVAIHIRRGDYISNKDTKSRHLVCQDDWYIKAVKMMQELISNPKFFVFSDDLILAKKIFNNFENLNIYFIPDDRREWFHMYLMTLCKNFIISNSSYSWWGSYLSKAVDKHIICPKYWNKGQLTTSIGINRKEFFLL